MLDVVNHDLASKGLRISTGTIVDATILVAPSSTRNAKKQLFPCVQENEGLIRASLRNIFMAVSSA